MIGMSVGFAFRSLFATVTGENVLVVIVVEVLVLVDVVVIGHSFCFCCIAQRDFEKCSVAVIKETGKKSTVLGADRIESTLDSILISLTFLRVLL